MFLPKTPFSKSNHFGIAINDNSVRVVSINHQGTLQNQQESIFNQPVIVGENLNKDVLIPTLKELISKLEIDQKYAAICIPEKYAYSRLHTFPNLNLKEVDEAISWQLEKIFPFSKKDIYYDWKLIHQEKQNISILVTVISKKMLDNLKDIMQAAGIFPISFEPSASALTRLAESDQSTQIILELNSQATSATLVVDNVSSLTTTTSFNQQTSSDQVLQQITASVQGLITHHKKNQSKKEDIKLILTGEKASNALTNVFKQSLGLDVHVLAIDNVEPKYHTAYIAAKTHILPPSSNLSINLLPTSLQIYYQAQSNYTLAKSVIKYVLASTITTIIIAAGIYLGLHLMVNRVINQSLSLQNKVSTDKTSQFDLGKVNQKANDIVQLFKLKKTPESLVEEISSSIPKDVIITNITINAQTNQFALSGNAKTREDLIALKENLEALDKFTKITLPLASLEIQEDINFNLSFKLIAP